MESFSSLTKAILWDFDGTIADTFPLVFFSLRQSFLYGDGRFLTDEDMANMFGPPEDEIIRRYFYNRDAVDWGIEFYHRLYGDYHEVFTVYHKRLHNLLENLYEKGCVQGIVTGKGRRSLALSLEHLGITGYFSTAVTGNDILLPKPHPESLLAALYKLGVSPEEAIMIGDSEADYLAAQALGMRCIVVGWYRIPSFSGNYLAIQDVESLANLFTHNYRFPPGLPH
ncbi:HAD family hydrolase [Thermospira aquatica]|uniref:phosphoglycolate phosphatase n=1 Tax=Thermospira aquatica TaxID=2828656 RepID=A0AAX3BCZ0_9SPIR|nr:HAD family hydrolase [Thermospira aquatica]URA10184.1 HAD family hydrolase [Thermospira aquatica]